MIKIFYCLSTVFVMIFLAGTAKSYSKIANDNRYGYIVNLTDIHFDPFYDSSIISNLIDSYVSKWDSIFEKSDEKTFGSYTTDTNYKLFTSALDSIKMTAPNPDFIIFTGDFICHHFNTQFTSFYNSLPKSSSESTNSEKMLHEFIYKTISFIVMKLTDTFPDTPIYFALGNDDSYEGDYKIEPSGDFLKDTGSLLRKHVFFSSLEEELNFSSNYGAGGYYCAGVPNIDNAQIIVLNSIFYTNNYEYDGLSDLHPGESEINWLSGVFEKAKKENKRLWLLSHVPLGIDVYSTLAEPQNSSGRITGAPVLFRVNDFNRRFVELIRKYHENIEVIFVGHTHMDWFELYSDVDGKYVAFNHLTPAVSPVYGNNPAYQIITYDKNKFKLKDFTVHYLNLEKANLSPEDAVWEKEYTFSEVYGHQTYNLGSLVNNYKKMINNNSKTMKNYVKFYTVGSTAQTYIDSNNWFSFYLAIGALMQKKFMSEMNEEL